MNVSLNSTTDGGPEGACRARHRDASVRVVQAGNDRSHVDRCLREVASFIAQLGLASAGEEAYEFENY